MNRVVVDIKSDSEARASEIIADLRTAAETLYYPMKLVGFWDHHADMHLCPQEERKQVCPHKLPESDPDHVEYEHTLQRERRANLEVTFPHAEVAIYLG